ncbi:MAG: DUF3857 and transglutaminase domain-containing protein [Opitutaceae bacterium]|nr:DUF3857 and transglutaminase domain-containing protein [Cytophagales bacterium]
MRIYLYLLFSCSYTFSLSQPKINLTDIRQRFPEASAVMLNEEILNLDVAGDKLTATRSHIIQYLILEEKAFGLAERTVTYIPGFFELANFEASTYVPNGRSYKKLKVTEWEDKNRISNMFFFDDVKYRHFVFPGVQKGAILELKYTYTSLDPTIQFPFHFQESVPLIKSSFTINHTDKVRPYVRFFGDTIQRTYTEETKGKLFSKTWLVKDVKEWKGHSNSPSIQYNLPHLFPLIKEYKTETKGWVPGLNTAKELYAHNYAFLKDLNVSNPDVSLTRLVDSLKQKSPSQEDLVRNIYYWVQDNMKYIAFEDGLGGFVPRQANDIFRKRYGDCKDMASVLTFMYKQAGIPAYVCWIGTRDLPYSYAELPAPNADNHMIAAVYVKNSWKFLDATARYLPYGYPSGFIQGKEALISISPDSFQVVKVPVMPYRENIRFDSTYITLNNEGMKGNISMKMEGYNKYYLIERLLLVKSHEKNEMFENMLSRGSNKCKITGIKYKNTDEREKPLLISAEMELKDYAKLIDDNWYLNLNLDRDYLSYKIDTTDRNISREFEHTFYDKHVYALEIPKGYKIGKLPNSLSYKGEDFGYQINYKMEGNKLVYRFELYVNTLLLDKKEFKEWNSHLDKIVQTYKETIVLEKKTL